MSPSNIVILNELCILYSPSNNTTSWNIFQSSRYSSNFTSVQCWLFQRKIFHTKTVLQQSLIWFIWYYCWYITSLTVSFIHWLWIVWPYCICYAACYCIMYGMFVYSITHYMKMYTYTEMKANWYHLPIPALSFWSISSY